jgi:hypothetical protein
LRCEGLNTAASSHSLGVRVQLSARHTYTLTNACQHETMSVWKDSCLSQARFQTLCLSSEIDSLDDTLATQCHQPVQHWTPHNKALPCAKMHLSDCDSCVRVSPVTRALEGCVSSTGRANKTALFRNTTEHRVDENKQYRTRTRSVQAYTME